MTNWDTEAMTLTYRLPPNPDGGVNDYATTATATLLIAPLEVPTLSSAMLALLALLLGFTGWRRSRYGR